MFEAFSRPKKYWLVFAGLLVTIYAIYTSSFLATA
jgi:hypothetical protein